MCSIGRVQLRIIFAWENYHVSVKHAEWYLTPRSGHSVATDRRDLVEGKGTES